MNPLTQWLPDADADSALEQWADAYAVAVETDDAEAVQALRGVLEEALSVAADRLDTVPDWAKPVVDDPDNPVGGDWIDADEDGEPVWPDDGDEPETVTEGRKKSRFTGQKRDSLGRRRCYQDGRQVRCDPLPDDPAPTDPPDPAKPWDKPDWERAESKGTRPKWVNADGAVRYGPRPPDRPEAAKRAEYEARQRRLAEPPRHSRSLTEEGAASLRVTSQVITGGDDPDGFVRLLGLPNGAVSSGTGQRDGRVITLSVSHPDVNNWSRTVRANADGTLSVSNNVFFLRPGVRGGGFGAKAFTEQVRANFLAGAKEIRTNAGKGGAGAEKMNGYYTWPRLGYDADLEPRYRYRLPAPLKGARTVQDLMETEEGRQHWKATGYMTEMTFDLSPGSRSLRRLNQYLAEKGKGTPPIPDADPAAVAAREQAIADRRERLAAVPPLPPPPPLVPQAGESPEEAARRARFERLGRLTNPVGRRFQESLDPDTRQELTRRVTADPDYSPAAILGRADADGDPAAERFVQDIWLRQSRRLAEEYVEAAVGRTGSDAQLVFDAVVRDAERAMQGERETFGPLVWQQMAANRYRLEYGPSDSGVLAALRTSWARQFVPGGGPSSVDLPAYLSADPATSAAAIAELRRAAGR